MITVINTGTFVWVVHESFVTEKYKKNNTLRLKFESKL